MSISTLTIANSSKPFPAVIRAPFLSFKDAKIDKIYPAMGLPNVSEITNAKFDFSDVDLNKMIKLALQRFVVGFNQERCLIDFKGFELYKISHILYMCGELSRRIDKNIGIAKTDSGTVLSTPIHGYDGITVIYKTGASIFKIAKDLLETGYKYFKSDLIDTKDIQKEFKNIKINFSSENMMGVWDISTMSMRGVKSCMRWEAKQSHSLVGSILDPYCGIIYLTNGTKTKYGSKMLFRALVRVLISPDHSKIALMVDRLYSCFYKNTPQEHSKLDTQVKQLFVDFLQKKLPNIKVYDSKAHYYNIIDNFRMPKPSVLDMLALEQTSYKDTHVEYTNTVVNTIVVTDVVKSLLKASSKSKKKIKKSKNENMSSL